MSAPAGYREAHEGVAVRDRSGVRRRILVSGRAPGQMLKGVVTGRIPAAPTPVEDGVLAGRADPSAVLTPKGRVVADLRLVRLSEDEADGFLLDVPEPAAGGLLEHLGRYVPPRFAAVEDVTARTGHLAVAGPGAPELLSRDALGLRVDAPVLDALDEGELRVVGEPGLEAVRVVRSGEVDAEVWEVLADRTTVEALRKRLVEAGAVPLSAEAWEALRVEAGTPLWGRDMDADTLLPETGLVDRLVDHAKGCYTGQEVVVRVRDRGRVNRHLQGLLPREPGADPSTADGEAGAGPGLWSAALEREVGTVTSRAFSPRAGRVLGLGYVRREVAPGETVRWGGADGPAAEVRTLGAGWWR